MDYLGSADHVVALAQVTAERADGLRLDVPEAVVFTVRDGRLVRARHMAYDEHSGDQFSTGMPTSR